jgi:hypothetical protein
MLLVFDVLLDDVRGAPPHVPAKEEPDQKCPPHRYRRTWLSYSWRSLRELTPLRELTSLESWTLGG